ncbi:DsbC family protein [Noviherbaspirillum aridicola]|uniref:Thiol:disulfide interchange protein n=1 Tax=Noviherbaspirillum aridicola TaxID=2849687 RepID=A0ABQ4Q8G4_9BURK|nr:DsbC family protein [Noviherbaspirillum aridicola]GIZ53504.1 thiol:disulfide interchange protein DsbC [Noviherbaspirillum aridicola]
MIKLNKLAAVLALGLAAAGAFAQTGTEAAIKKAIEPRLGEGVKIDSVTKTPYAGLYEIRIGGDIFYTDAKGEYLFLGRVVNSKTFEDYTKARTDEINRIKFSDLPLDAAMKQVKGNGKRVIAVFEDPNCGYCKRFRQTLNEMDNVTVYTFMYNILSEDSVTKSRNIWCSADRARAWDDWMIRGKQPEAAAASCTTPHEKVFALGQRLRVTGTPTIFFTDGSRIPGAVDAKTLESKLASIK